MLRRSWPGDLRIGCVAAWLSAAWLATGGPRVHSPLFGVVRLRGLWAVGRVVGFRDRSGRRTILADRLTGSPRQHDRADDGDDKQGGRHLEGQQACREDRTHYQKSLSSPAV